MNKDKNIKLPKEKQIKCIIEKSEITFDYLEDKKEKKKIILNNNNTRKKSYNKEFTKKKLKIQEKK